MSIAALAALLDQPDLKRVFAALAAQGEETRIVGGAVRDALLGHTPGEIDLATTLAPQETMRRARQAGLKSVPTGIDHGTVTIVVDGTPFEVTTLREDIDTDGRRAKVRFGRDFDADARRRDFTINALSLGLDGTLHDPVGGLADLEARRVRFIGDPRRRIREDYLRTLRFFRFHARFGEGKPDAAGLAAAIAEREGLRGLSRERVRAELLKLLAAPRAVEAVTLLMETGLFGLLTGGVGDLGRLRRACACDADGADPILRLGALAVFSGIDVERLRERLRLSNSEHDRLATLAGLLVRFHGAAAPWDEQALLRLALVHGDRPVVEACAILAGEPRPVLTADGQKLLEDWRAGARALPVFTLTGERVMAAGVPKGPAIGLVLAHARDLWVEARCPAEPTRLAALCAQAVADWEAGRLATVTSSR